MNTNAAQSDRNAPGKKVKKCVIALVGAITLCGFALDASARIYSDNVQSANATLSDCVVLNIGTSPETVLSIKISYYDELLHPHVLTQTIEPQVVQPGDAVFIQDGYSLPRSEGFLVPSTSCAVVTSNDGDFRAVFELRDKNGDTLINDALR